ncbi:MAG: ATP synthase subunit C [Halobacteriota archaeon]
MKSKYGFAFTLCLLLLLTGVGVASAQDEVEIVEIISGEHNGLIALAAGIAMAGSALGAGLAISATGVAAAGATAEKPESFGRVLIFVALAEAIAIYGLLIAFMLWTNIKVVIQPIGI